MCTVLKDMNGWLPFLICVLNSLPCVVPLWSSQVLFDVVCGEADFCTGDRIVWSSFDHVGQDAQKDHLKTFIPSWQRTRMKETRLDSISTGVNQTSRMDRSHRVTHFPDDRRRPSTAPGKDVRLKGCNSSAGGPMAYGPSWA